MTEAEVPRVALAYLGCKVNQAEIEELGEQFRQAGFVVVPPHDGADAVIVNTCTITHVADHKARLLIRQAARRRPGALIVATGCYATVNAQAVAAIEGVDLVVGNSDKARLVELVAARLGSVPVAGIPSGPAASPLARTRTMLKVQDGCAAHCTYCIVPRARGPVRSVPLASVVEAVRRRVSQGYKEVVLTGVALGSYGTDWAPTARGGCNCTALTRLVGAILKETDVKRLRLSSVEPENLDPAVFALWANPRFARHLHLPLQSGCDATLRRMGRRYRTAVYAELVQWARAAAPDIAITTDVIVGFPGESEAEFRESYDFAAAMTFAKIHVFRFSARQGTPAARLPGQIAEQVKKERASAMLELSDQAGRAFRRRFVGTVRPVLWEDKRETVSGKEGGAARLWTGLTDNYVRVYAQCSENMRNRLVPVFLEGEATDGLVGRALHDTTADERGSA